MKLLMLQQMIKTNDVKDQTDMIRSLKHSDLIRNDVKKLLELREQILDEQELFQQAGYECNFLFTYYTDIFNKIRKRLLNEIILYKFLDVLKDIEESKVDQHEGSYRVGMYLKELYIDSQLKLEEKLTSSDSQTSTQTQTQSQPSGPTNTMSWKDFKKSIRVK